MFSKTHYEILNIQTTADQDQIKSAWRKKAIELHPDKNSGRDTTEEMQAVNHAHDVLSDNSSRREYDRLMEISSQGKNIPTEDIFSRYANSFFGQQNRADSDSQKTEFSFKQWHIKQHISDLFIYHPALRGCKDNISIFNIYNPTIVLPINGNIYLQRRMDNFLASLKIHLNWGDNTVEYMIDLPKNKKLMQRILQGIFQIYKLPEPVINRIYENLWLPMLVSIKKSFEDLFETKPHKNYIEAQLGKWNLKLTRAHLFIEHPDLQGCKNDISFFNMHSDPTLALPINYDQRIKEFLTDNVLKLVEPIINNDVEMVIRLPREKERLEKIYDCVFYIYNFPEDLILNIQKMNLATGFSSNLAKYLAKENQEWVSCTLMEM